MQRGESRDKGRFGSSRGEEVHDWENGLKWKRNWKIWKVVDGKRVADGQEREIGRRGSIRWKRAGSVIGFHIDEFGG